jgi:hypothetical protein
MFLRQFFTFIISFSFLSLNAQSAKEQFESRKDIFLGNNIYVIYTGIAKLDSSLKESFTKFWTIRPIKGFITEKELKIFISEPKNSFFYTTPYSYQISRTGGYRFTSGIFAFNGGRKNTGKYNLLYESVSITYFDSYRAESKLETVAYRLPLLIADLQNDINLKYDSTTALKIDKRKILVINEKLVEGKGSSIDRESLAAWPWKYELMSPEKIAILIRERNNQYVLLTPTLSDANSCVTIHDLASMRVVATASKFNIMREHWVRDKVIVKLVESINSK